MTTQKSTRLYQDIDLDFAPHPLTGDVTKKINEEAIKRSIRNIILYNRYEKPFRPFFGAHLREMLFENVKKSTALGIETRIRKIIEQYEPRCQIITVKATPDINNSQYEVEIEFTALNVLNPLTTTVYLQRIR